jgi:periplasmic protein TonB
MTPLKGTLERGNLSRESAASQASVRSRQESGHLRSDAVSLEVPVKVHGSRVTEVVRGITAHTEPFEEQSATMIVFPQGGVLKMSATVSAGQMVVITNSKSGQDAICRVMKVRPYGNAHSYVEIEFTQRQPAYWGVYFPSDGPELAKKVVPAAASSVAPVATTPAATPVAPADPVQTLVGSTAPAVHTSAAKPSEASTISSPVNLGSVPAKCHAQPNLPKSRFVSIGSHEDVQPAALETAGAKADPFAKGERHSPAVEAVRKSATVDFPAAPPQVFRTSVSMADLQGDTQDAPLQSASRGAAAESADATTPAIAEPSTEKPSVTFGRFVGGAGLGGGRPAPEEMFGVRLGSAVAGCAGHAAETGRNWTMLAASAAVLLAAIGGGAFYFYGRPAANRVPISISAVPALSVEENVGQNSVSQPPIPSSSSVSSPIAQLSPSNSAAAIASEPAVTVRASKVAPTKPHKVSRVVESQPSGPVRQGTASATPDMSALNTHPVSSWPASAGPSGAPPSLDAGAVPGMGASAVNLAVPAQPVPKAPLRIGGNIKPPRMISSILPVYPSIAQQAGVEGNVVVETVVDKAGHIASMKVVSGPFMLRQAALDSLRQWKYEPSTLNGQPVSVKMIVTIQFHR